MSRRRKEYLGKQREAVLSKLQSQLIWMPMMPPCGWRAETEQAFLRAHSTTRRVKGWSEKPGASAYLDGHVLEAVSCILHYFAKTEYGAEGICYDVINAGFEVGSGGVGKNIPPKVRRKQKWSKENLKEESEVALRYW